MITKQHLIIAFFAILLAELGWTTSTLMPLEEKELLETTLHPSLEQLTDVDMTEALIVNSSNKTRQLRVALFFTNGLPLLDEKFGYFTSAGAVSLALERIQREQVLPNVDLSFHVSFSNCDEAKAVGEVIRLIEEEDINVLVGPPCSVAAQATGVIAKYYDIPMMSWGATSEELADAERFSTITRVISESTRVGRALLEMLTYFDWRRFALIYTDDKATRNCYSIAKGLRKAVSKASVINVYNLEIDSSTVTDEQIQKFLEGMKVISRVAIVCLEHEEDVRRFMLKAYDMGMAGADYVYIMPSYVRDQNRSEMWLQYSDALRLDDRDVEAKEAFKSVLMLQAKLSSDEDIHHFKKNVIQRIQDYPFHETITDLDIGKRYGSLYSPFLHDSIYLYALAVNRTIEAEADIKSGRQILKQTSGSQFLGVTGHVVIDQTGGRNPNFVVQGFDYRMRMTSFAELQLHKPDGETMHMMVPLRMMWEARNGFVPVDSPPCGFYGELCKQKTNEKLMIYVIIGVTMGSLLVIIILLVVAGYVRKHLKTEELSKKLWQIDGTEIQFVSEKYSSRIKSSNSLGSIKTISTTLSEHTQEAIAKGHINIACYKDRVVWTKVHNTSVVLNSHEDYEHMRLMKDIVHDNLNRCFGVCLDTAKPFSVWAYCSKGSLQDILQNENYKLDWIFKLSLIKDLASATLGAVGPH